MSETNEKNFSMKELKEILAVQAAENARLNTETLKTIIEELKKPTVLEQAELDKKLKEALDQNEERKNNAAGQLQMLANKRDTQKWCSHKHRDGNTHCVAVSEKTGPGYILCQLNQCIIRPGVAPTGYQGTDIYDTALYNRIFQELPHNEIFG